MRKNNWLYVLYLCFSSDLLFWIVIDNLFLTTVKGFDAFDIVLITMFGIAISLLFYPITNLIVKKTRNKTSIIIGSICYCFAIIFFIVSNSLLGFIIGQAFYNLSSPFRMVANVMLKNNLKEKEKESDYVKWQSYGKLGYAIITLIIALISGVLFNLWVYLPMILSFVCAVVGLMLSLIYTDGVKNVNNKTTKVKITNIIKTKPIILIMLMNFLAVGTYVFMQGKASLLIQYVCHESGFNIAKISIIVSALVFGSRVVRVVSDLLFPKIYKKVKHKNIIVLSLGLLILFSNISFSLGGNLNVHYILKLILIIVGFYIILSVRDIYSVTENKIITRTLKEQEQKQAFVLVNIFEKIGRLITNIFAVVLLGFVSLNFLYVCMLIFSITQFFVCIPLSKFLKE